MNTRVYSFFKDPEPRCLACNAPLEMDREAQTCICPACGWPEANVPDYVVPPFEAYGRFLTVVPRLYGRATITAASIQMHELGGWDEGWHYASAAAAVAALVEWLLDRQLDGEPEGWERHQPSNRRRAGGDPAREEVRP